MAISFFLYKHPAAFFDGTRNAVSWSELGRNFFLKIKPGAGQTCNSLMRQISNYIQIVLKDYYLV